MYCNGPCKAEGILGERAFYLLFYFLCGFIDCVAHIFPNNLLYKDILFLTCFLVYAPHHDTVSRDCCHDAYSPIVISSWLLNVVLNEHHLSTYFQCQMLFCWKRLLRKCTLYIRLEGICVCGYFLYLPLVKVVCLKVMCCKSNPRVLFSYLLVFRREVRYISAIQQCEHLFCNLILSDGC